MTDIVPVLGVLAGAIGVADTIPYIRDILRGTTRPAPRDVAHLGRPGVVVCLSQRADGASWSLIMAATQARAHEPDLPARDRARRRRRSARELVMITIAGTGVIGWIVAGEPVVATACIVAADLIAAALMVPKTYRDPDRRSRPSRSRA